MTMNEIVATNKKRQQEAQGLNVRAGETLFKVYSLTEITTWITERLKGARRVVEVSNPEDLCLPELDKELVGKVLRDNPEEIMVLGRMAKVVYQQYTTEPTVRIDFRGAEAKDWLKLPAEGIRLPGGREIMLYSAIDGYRYYVESLSSKFVAKACELLNGGQWEKFHYGEKPEISLPDPAVESSEVPVMCKHQYGICQVTGEALCAYGTLKVKRYCYSGESKFEPSWVQTLEEAEKLHTASIEKLSALRKELVEKKTLEALQEEARLTKERVIAAEKELARKREEALELDRLKKAEKAQKAKAFDSGAKGLGSLESAFDKLNLKF